MECYARAALLVCFVHENLHAPLCCSIQLRWCARPQGHPNALRQLGVAYTTLGGWLDEYDMPSSRATPAAAWAPVGDAAELSDLLESLPFEVAAPPYGNRDAGEASEPERREVIVDAVAWPTYVSCDVGVRMLFAASLVSWGLRLCASACARVRSHSMLTISARAT